LDYEPFAFGPGMFFVALGVRLAMSDADGLLAKAKEAVARSTEELLAPGGNLSSGTTSLAGRLRILLRRTINRGPSLLLLSAIFVAASAHAARALIFHFIDYQSQVERTLAAHYETSQNRSYYGVMGALLGPLTQSNIAAECGTSDVDLSPLLSPTSKLSCHRIRVIHAALATLWEATSSSDPKASVDKVRSLLAAECPGFGDWNAWQQQTETDLLDLRQVLTTSASPQGHAASLVVPCSDAMSALYHPQHQTDFGPMGCDRLERSTTLVVASRTNTCPEEPSSFCVHQRAAEGLAASLLADDVLQPLAQSQLSSAISDFDDIRFVQAYFISPDDVLRIWDSHGKSTNPQDTYPPSHRWASAPYFERFMHEPVAQRILTSPYIDFGGHGLVRTLCHSLTTRSEPAARFIGIFCQDFTIPLKELARSIGPDLLDVRYVDVRIPNGSSIGPDNISIAHTLAELRNGTQGSTSERQLLSQQLFQAALEGAPGSTPVEARSLLRNVSPLASDNSFLVPLGRLRDGDDDFRALVVGPQGKLARLFSLPGFALIGCLLPLFLCVYYGTRRGLQLAEMDVQTTMVNSLHVGVLFLSDGTTVEAGNARAEDIVGLNVPRLGVTETIRVARWRLEDFLESTIIKVDPSGTCRMEAVASLRHYRLLGVSQDYYAKLRLGQRRGEWIRVTDCPANIRTLTPQGGRSIDEVLLIDQISDSRFWHFLEAQCQLLSRAGAWIVLDTQGKIKLANDLAKATLGLSSLPTAGQPLDNASRVGFKDILEPWSVQRDGTSGGQQGEVNYHVTVPCNAIASALGDGEVLRYGRLKTGVRKRYWVGFVSTQLPRTALTSTASKHTLVEVLAVDDRRVRKLCDRLVLTAGPEPILLLDKQDRIEAANAEGRDIVGADLPLPDGDEEPQGVRFGSLIEQTIILRDDLVPTEYRPGELRVFYANAIRTNRWLRVSIVEKDSRWLCYVEVVREEVQEQIISARDRMTPATIGMAR